MPPDKTLLAIRCVIYAIVLKRRRATASAALAARVDDTPESLFLLELSARNPHGPKVTSSHYSSREERAGAKRREPSRPAPSPLARIRSSAPSPLARTRSSDRSSDHRSLEVETHSCGRDPLLRSRTSTRSAACGSSRRRRWRRSRAPPRCAAAGCTWRGAPSGTARPS